MFRKAIVPANNETPGSVASVVWLVGVVLGLTVGLVDVSLGLLFETSGFSLLYSILVPLGGVVFLTILFFCLAMTFCIPLARIAGLHATSTCVALGVLGGVLYMLAFSQELVVLSRVTTVSSAAVLPFSVSTLALIALVTAIGVYRYALGPQQTIRPAPETLRRLALAFPFVLALCVAALVLGNTWIDSLTSFRGLLVIALLVAGVVAVVFLSAFHLRERTLARAAIGFACVVIVSPLAQMYCFDSVARAFSPSPSGNPPVPYIVLLTVDTLRADHLSCYGAQHHQTPNIDGLAAEGVVFERAVSPSPWTIPSLASIMTGVSPDVHGAIRPQADLPPAVPTLAEHMFDAGYATAAFAYQPFLPACTGFGRGFTAYHLLRRNNASLGGRLNKLLLPSRYVTATTSSHVTDGALAWIEDNHDRPFMLWVHYYDPHLPYTPPRKYLPDRTPPESIGVRFTQLGEVRKGRMRLSRTEREWVNELYSAEVRYIDNEIGRLVSALRRLGIYDKALMVFASDHGEEFWDHGAYEHGHTLYREQLWVPLVVKAPGQSSPKTIQRVVSTESIMPTILDVCAMAPEGVRFSAPSLAPLWHADAEEFEFDGVVSGSLLYFEDGESVTTQEFKYIEMFYSERWELFDLSRDPGEQTPLRTDVAQRVALAHELLQAHHQRSQELREHYGLAVERSEGIDVEAIERLKSLGYTD